MLRLSWTFLTLLIHAQSYAPRPCHGRCGRGRGLGLGLGLGGPFAGSVRRQATPPEQEVESFSDLVEALLESPDPLWELMRFEARTLRALDVDSKVYREVENANTLSNVVSNRLARELETPFLSATQLQIIFTDLLQLDPELRMHIAFDTLAAAVRDDETGNLVSAAQLNKGLHAVMTYRFCHVLQDGGRQGLARFLHSQNSEVFMADIHPSATIGKRFFIASASGVVIGETARVGDDVSMAHFVTLGGNGKDTGDRHPKVADGVFLGAGAQIIGNITVGEGSVVAANAVVVKPVPPFSRVAGVPAKVAAYYACELPVQGDLSDDQPRRFYMEHTL